MPIQSRITKAVAGLPNASSDTTSALGYEEAFVGLDDAFLEAAFLQPGPSSPRASRSSGSSLAAPPAPTPRPSHGREGANSRASNRVPTELDPAQICDVWGYYLSEATPNGGWFSQEDRDGLLEYLERKVRTTPWQLFVSPFTGETAMDCPLLRVKSVAEVTIQLNEWEHNYIRASKLVQQRGWSFTESKNTAYENKAIYNSCADFFKLHAIICRQLFSSPMQGGPSEPKSEPQNLSPHPSPPPLPPSPPRVFELEAANLIEVLKADEHSVVHGGKSTKATNKPESQASSNAIPTASSAVDKGKKRKMSEADLDQEGHSIIPHINRASTPYPYKRARRTYLNQDKLIPEDPTSKGTASNNFNSTMNEDPAVAIARYQYLSRKAELDFQLEIQKLEYQRQREEREAMYKAQEADNQRRFELEKLRMELSLQELRLRGGNQ
ncbi:hypothetical protein TWF506_005732 [Arthrobotrys conoides]|uniref:Uncharacterized protein n=1 Tax=Arthrobotrys conoides TaxID=74498 RepID=A0AAN8P7D4_9PEZI